MTYCHECDEGVDECLALDRDGRTLCPTCFDDEEERDFPLHLEYDEGGDW